ncbi:MAG: tRNA uridine-5-carboxymethylaminomethyl(34) synthesis GTPase MnmE [Verrucomicrobia bacterium]|nr:MAG: tRNA uridine-5-carboxymethylaminomethyl(34) synthesis GTPase MnmE [Verrucomicrobiota bacterium]TAE89192.1 MAG: tRNA uridine-5-carboxymethylaminomethyl(34) synthesis GTPase MnmE [Verrucomicrobiota bacterium]TAF27932.1 MAG: tRNA uridine-5-carboxymethylaminomethyl(34) synthesis GTPase MnmE [Verrucomicrobiota bacterium]TAF42781.1 MAG: tRNA uridine-5-carboxymethylaminomethyl(34) synthesis GTPase MnmE [Verrucomicrobiota bacterium]
MTRGTVNFDSIVALASGGGTSAVALIRVSGPQAVEIADRASAGAAGRAIERRATRAKILDAAGRTLDDVLMTVFHGTRSFTGEPVVEIACHGGRLVTRRVIERLLECGARSAGPGEFSERAFLHGKLDLTQAEAVMDLISAQSDLALRAAHEQLEGGIGRLTGALREDLIGLIAHLEAWIDFPEEDIDPDTGELFGAGISRVRVGIDRLLATAEQGRILREGVRTVICGRPNAGKSSLLNLLLGSERAIVSDEAGTTRDTIEEVLLLDGVPLRLIDTAGLRVEAGVVEREGIRRTLQEAIRADLLLVVRDASLPLSDSTVELPDSRGRVLTVLNKCDLGEHPEWKDQPGVRLCCLGGEGVEPLRREIRAALDLGEADWGEHAVAINTRHRDCLKRADDALREALNLLSQGAAPELAALEMRSALESLGEICGKVDTEEILGAIFSRFCIGK